MTDENQNFSFYISILTGSLLTVSEILPYINSIRSNGILHLCTNICNYLINKSPRSNINDNDTERQPILQQPQNLTSQNVNLTSQNVNLTSPNVNVTFSSPNVQLFMNKENITL